MRTSASVVSTIHDTWRSQNSSRWFTDVVPVTAPAPEGPGLLLIPGVAAGLQPRVTRAYNDFMFCRTIGVFAFVGAMALASESLAQPPVARPQPPPTVATTTTPAPQAPAAQAPAKPAAVPLPAGNAQGSASPPSQAAAPKVQPPAGSGSEPAPTDASLGVPVYPGARFLGSYDAGRGQRYYLFGTTLSFAEIVNYYKAALKDKGELVFEQPPTHMFDIGKFKEETMAFPPSVTVKDYAWAGSPGYANPQPGTAPSAFPTVIQIVPQPTPSDPSKK
jgi:hypothetical protein